MRNRILLASMLLLALNLQGCATSFQTFTAGALVGGALVGLNQCARYCY